MSYTVPYTDESKDPIIVDDNSTNTQTSLTFTGTGAISYGKDIATNFLSLLENFANTTQPSEPIEGQLWYSTQENNRRMYVYNGARWMPVSGIHLSEPSVPDDGDIWINTNSKSLYIYMGSAWVLIATGEGALQETGITSDAVYDVSNVLRTILRININKNTVAIISESEFKPKAYIRGFDHIYAGFNVSRDHNNYIGSAKQARNLELADKTIVSSDRIVRTDTPNTLEHELFVESNQGISIGDLSQLSLGIDDNNISYVQSQNIKLQTNVSGNITDVITITEQNNIGIFNDRPEYDLDISGNVRSSGPILISDVTDTSIVTHGGIGVQKNVTIGRELHVSGDSFVNHILPNNNNVHIGTTGAEFEDIVSKNIHADHVYGIVHGTVQGNAISANKLSTATTFRLVGDVVTTDDVIFDGEVGGNTQTFNTQLGTELISTKDESTCMEENDMLLIQKTSPDVPPLMKISKAGLLSSFPITPAGTVVPFAGSVAPFGWLLCNGQTITRTTYPILYDVIGLTYTEPGTVVAGQYKVPDLRGRFPLGKNDMGGVASSEVLAEYAQTLGKSGGSETHTLQPNNIPQHTHILSADGKSYYTITESGDIGEHIEVGTWVPGDQLADRKKLFVNDSTGTVSDLVDVEPINQMNPSLTLNYIIFTGKV